MPAISQTSVSAVSPPNASTLAQLRADLESQAATAEAYNATAPVAGVLRSVVERLAGIEAGNGTPPTAKPDRLMKVEEVAERLGMSRSWVYQNRRSLPCYKEIKDGVVRFSERKLERFLAGRSV